MLFNSLGFLFFFTIVYLLYLPLSYKWQNALLIIASCFFYAVWNWKFLFLMLVSISTDFWCSQYMERTEDVARRRLFLSISLFVNLGILGFFKYYNFFVENFVGLLQGLHLASPSLNLTLNIILPLGVSFYTFEAMSYVIDVYKKRIKPARRYWDYLLFVIYFPHLIAGPIMRARDFLPQITAKRHIDGDKFGRGVYLVFLGLFQKMFIADNMAKIANPIFNDGISSNGADILVGMYTFTFQIFGDFAGYSNIARGLGLMMGFEITVNFNTPFFATNVQDYWNRWHITLSQWIRDYIYLPLVEALHRIKGNARLYLALIISMALIGLWHGASWNFVVFGLYYGVLLSLYLFIRMRYSRFMVVQGPWKARAWFFLRVVFLFHLVVIGMMIFRSRSLSQANSLLKDLFFNFHITAANGHAFMHFVLFFIPIILLQLGEFLTKDIFFVLRQPWLLRHGILAVMLYLWLGWGAMEPEKFIYFQF